MAKQYFYSPDLSECAGCGQYIPLTRGLGATTLDAPGQPHMYYTLCERCLPQLIAREIDFVDWVERRVVARGRQLGAFGPDAQAESLPEAQMGGAQ
jgi:hypothetical protein